jgi:hypothetical protein
MTSPLYRMGDNKPKIGGRGQPSRNNGKENKGKRSHVPDIVTVPPPLGV